MKKLINVPTISIKTSFNLFIGILCWFIPLTFLIVSTGVYFNSVVNKEFEAKVTASAKYSIGNTEKIITDVIAETNKIIYQAEILNFQQEYEQTKDKTTRYTNTQEYLRKNYYNETKINYAGIWYHDEQDIFNYLQTKNDITNRISFKNNIFDTMKTMAEEKNDDTVFFQKEEKIYMMKNINKKDNTPFATICFEINHQLIFESFKEIPQVKDIVIWINGEKFDIFHKDAEENESACIAYMPPYSELNYPKNDTAYVFNNKEAIVYGTLHTVSVNVRYFATIDNVALKSQTKAQAIIFMALAVLVCIILMGSTLYFKLKIIKPIDKLVLATKKIEQEEYGYQIIEKYNSVEFDYITQAFNKMSEKLELQFKKIYQEEITLRDAKIMALELQMNPHFLNNTLEIINWESRAAGNNSVSEMIENLSVMLNATMNRKKQTMIPLKEELSYVDAYLYIIKARMGERLEIKKDINTSLLNQHVPRLIMQPIIENAVEHGVSALKKGEISISITSTKDKIVIKIENNGELTPQDIEKIQKSLTVKEEQKEIENNHLGIKNVNQRLKIIYGEKASVEIKINKKMLTETKIIIPNNQ